MSTRKRPLCTFTLDPQLRDGLDHLRRRDGTSASETVRRALRAWMLRKDVVLDLGDEGVFGRDGDATVEAPDVLSPASERELDEGDLHLVLRALRRLRVGRREDARRRRLVAQLEHEIDELLVD